MSQAAITTETPADLLPPGDMTPRARLERVLAGELPDRPPVSFWVHNFAREQTVGALVDETLRLQRAFRFDFLKPQSPAHAGPLAWGATITSPKRRDEAPVLVRPAMRSAADLADITPRPIEGMLADQVEAMRRIREAVGPDVPIVGTIFSPLMVMWQMHEGLKPAVLEMVREAPAALTPALDAIAETMADFARALIEKGGVDGIFYATTTCNEGELTEAEHERYHLPYDKEILSACKGGWMNILHLCGHHVLAKRFVDHEAQIVSWELGPHNPTLTEMHGLLGRTMLTGIPGKPVFGADPQASLFRHARNAVAETGGRHLILGPGCSVNPGVEDGRIGAVVEDARAIRYPSPERA